jgi:hypothetical protein
MGNEEAAAPVTADAVREAVSGRIKDIIAGLEAYAAGLPFRGTDKTVTPPADAGAGKKPGGKEPAEYKGSCRKWPGLMRGWGSLTRRYPWETDRHF